MEFHPQLPQGASEQLARVSRNLAAQSPDHVVTRKPWQDYPDVEAFLDRHGETFSVTEQCWREVSNLKKQIDEFATQPIAPSEAYTDDKGVTHATFRVIDDESRSLRRFANERSINTRIMIAKLNQNVHGRITEWIGQGFLNELPENYRLTDILAAAAENRKEHKEKPAPKSAIPRHSFVSQGVPVEALSQKVSELIAAYEGAFAGQYIGIYEIQALLADDRHVLPFVNRLQELAVLSQGGWVEFPGLLETVQVHLTESKLKGRRDSIQSALHRIAGELCSREVFVRSLVDPNSEETPPPINQSEAFLGGVATAQALAAILGGGKAVNATPAEIIGYIADGFDDMPDDWRTAYESAKGSAVMDVWGRLGTLLRPFERSGRLVSNINTERVLGPPAAQEKANTKKRPRRRAPRRSAPKSNPTEKQTADRNLGDIITQSETESEVAPPTFAILKGTGSVGRRVYNIERIGDLDDLMDTSMVKGFLRGKAGLTDDLRTLLQTIMDDPLGRSKTLDVRNAFRIKDKGVPGVSHPLRRYSPRKGAVEGGTSHELASQVRIFFTTTIVDGKKCVALEGIKLRDSDTY